MKTFALTLLISLIIPVSYAMDCEILANDCQFYLCQEMQRNCGERGYLVNFGHRYCQEFISVEADSFSEEGRLWLGETRRCLMHKIDEIPADSSCRALKRQSFKDHVPCYVKSGFCQLPRKDKLKVMGLIRKTWYRPNILWSGLKVLNSCYSPF